MRPSACTIDGTVYAVADGDNAFRVIYEPTIQQQGDIAGASRPSKTARPDILQWTQDDWSGGEGQRFIKSTDDASFTRYQDSDGPVDVLTPGQIKLGKRLITSNTLNNNAATVAHLATAGGNLFAFFTDGVPDAYVKKFTISTATWGSIVDLDLGDNLRGPVAVVGNRMFAGTSSNIMVVSTTPTVAVYIATAGNNYNMLAADNRLFYVNDGTNLQTLRVIGADTAGTAVTAGTMKGPDQTIAMAGQGTNVYVLAGRPEEQLKLYRWDGTVLTEFAYVPSTFRAQNNTRDVLKVMNGIVFAGGYTSGDDTNTEDKATLLYFTPESSGTVGSIEDLASRSATQRQIQCMQPINDNILLMGMKYSAEIYAYNVSTGGLSFYAKVIEAGSGTFSLTSLASEKGNLFAAGHLDDGSPSVQVYRNDGALYPTDAVTIAGSIWDFGLPHEEKLLLSVEVHASISGSDTVAIKFKLDDGAVVSTDSAGAPMTMVAGETRKLFTISGADVERTFRYLEPRLVLDGGGGTVTPTVYSVSWRATTAGKSKFYEVKINGKKNKTPVQAITGAKAMQTLRTLTENSSNRIIGFTPYYLGAPAPYWRGANGSSTVEDVMIDAASFDLDNQGEGVATLRLRSSGGSSSGAAGAAAASSSQQETYSRTGTVAVETGASRWYPPYNISIIGVRASVNTAPTGASLIVDVNKDGTTIFTTQANRPTIVAAGFTDTADAIDVGTVLEGSYLTVDVDQVGSTVAGADLTVTIEYVVSA